MKTKKERKEEYQQMNYYNTFLLDKKQMEKCWKHSDHKKKLTVLQNPEEERSRPKNIN